MSDKTSSQHLSDRESAAYVDGRLSPSDRARAEAHLEECDGCRREVIEVSRVLLDTSLPTARPRPRILVPVLAGAAAVLAVLLVRPDVAKDGEPSQVRDAGTTTEGIPLIPVVSPIQGDTIGPAERELVWRSVGPDATYRLTLGSAPGRILWRATTSDTSQTIPSDVRLVPETMYFWHVDALLPSGVSATTRARSFTVKRQ